MESHEILQRVVESVGVKHVASDLGVSTSLVYEWCARPTTEGSGARNPLDRLLSLIDATEDRRSVE
jgi:transposase